MHVDVVVARIDVDVIELLRTPCAFINQSSDLACVRPPIAHSSGSALVPRWISSARGLPRSGRHAEALKNLASHARGR